LRPQGDASGHALPGCQAMDKVDQPRLLRRNQGENRTIPQSTALAISTKA
jgi:hypothetical protein